MNQSELPEGVVERMIDFALYCAFYHPELLSEWENYRRNKHPELKNFHIGGEEL